MGRRFMGKFPRYTKLPPHIEIECSRTVYFHPLGHKIYLNSILWVIRERSLKR